MRPIARPGDYLILQKTTGLDLYEVQFVDSLPRSAPLCVNLAASGLAAGVSTGATPIALNNQEYQNNGWLAQFRFHVMDPVSVQLYQGQAIAKNTVQLTQAVFTPRQRFVDPHDTMSEHFVYEQNPAYMVATNYLGITVNLARVGLYGYTFVLAGGGPRAGTRGGGVNQSPLMNFKSVDDAETYLKKNNAHATMVPIAGWGA
jgi:hypothetical protein